MIETEIQVEMVTTDREKRNFNEYHQYISIERNY